MAVSASSSSGSWEESGTQEGESLNQKVKFMSGDVKKEREGAGPSGYLLQKRDKIRIKNLKKVHTL